MRYLIVLLVLSLSLTSCNSTPKKSGSNTKKAVNTTSTDEVNYIRSVKIVSPKKHSQVIMNDKISLDFSISDGQKTDSLLVFVDGKLVKTFLKAPYKCDYVFSSGRVGNRQIKAIAFHGKNRRGLAVTSITLKPDKAPKRRMYNVVKTYKHDTSASTQGLVFHKGFLYEGTGLRGESCIKKFDLKNNRLVSELDIDKKLFGEGIAIINNKIIQLTWTSQRGFVYNIDTFSLESEFHYSTQGWGITTIGDKLVMSDGSNKLYFIDPNSFDVLSEVEVFDNNGAVDQLNELEYINGMIYANVWMTNRIVMIDPSTGIIKEDVDLTGILSSSELASLTDGDYVLNGIAYDEDTKRLFVTGKCWPKLFHITLK